MKTTIIFTAFAALAGFGLWLIDRQAKVAAARRERARLEANKPYGHHTCPVCWFKQFWHAHECAGCKYPEPAWNKACYRIGNPWRDLRLGLLVCDDDTTRGATVSAFNVRRAGLEEPLGRSVRAAVATVGCESQDEARALLVRANDRTKTTYNNLVGNGSFYTVGAEVTLSEDCPDEAIDDRRTFEPRKRKRRAALNPRGLYAPGGKELKHVCATAIKTKVPAKKPESDDQRGAALDERKMWKSLE